MRMVPVAAQPLCAACVPYKTFGQNGYGDMASDSVMIMVMAHDYNDSGCDYDADDHVYISRARHDKYPLNVHTRDRVFAKKPRRNADRSFCATPLNRKTLG